MSTTQKSAQNGSDTAAPMVEVNIPGIGAVLVTPEQAATVQAREEQQKREAAAAARMARVASDPLIGARYVVETARPDRGDYATFADLLCDDTAQDVLCAMAQDIIDASDARARAHSGLSMYRALYWRYRRLP